MLSMLISHLGKARLYRQYRKVRVFGLHCRLLGVTKHREIVILSHADRKTQRAERERQRETESPGGSAERGGEPKRESKREGGGREIQRDREKNRKSYKQMHNKND